MPHKPSVSPTNASSRITRFQCKSSYSSVRADTALCDQWWEVGKSRTDAALLRGHLRRRLFCLHKRLLCGVATNSTPTQPESAGLIGPSCTPPFGQDVNLERGCCSNKSIEYRVCIWFCSIDRLPGHVHEPCDTVRHRFGCISERRCSLGSLLLTFDASEPKCTDQGRSVPMLVTMGGGYL